MYLGIFDHFSELQSSLRNACVSLTISPNHIVASLHLEALRPSSGILKSVGNRVQAVRKGSVDRGSMLSACFAFCISPPQKDGRIERNLSGAMESVAFHQL